MIPAAAIAVIRAELEDAAITELLHRPGWTAQRIVHALADYGWTVTAHERTIVPEAPAQSG